MTAGQMRNWSKIKVSPSAFKEVTAPVDTASKACYSGEGYMSKKATGKKW